VRKIKFLLVVMLGFLLLPFSVFAEDNEKTEENNTEATDNVEKEKVNIYFFRGDGCSHCAEAEEWFDSIKEEYGKYFTIKDYETWYNEENANLMKEVAESRGESADGVPYIIVGNKSWNGFAESYTSEILDQIKSEYKKDSSDRYDTMQLFRKTSTKKKSNSSDIFVALLIIMIVGGVVSGLIYARKHNA